MRGYTIPTWNRAEELAPQIQMRKATRKNRLAQLRQACIECWHNEAVPADNSNNLPFHGKTSTSVQEKQKTLVCHEDPKNEGRCWGGSQLLLRIQLDSSQGRTTKGMSKLSR